MLYDTSFQTCQDEQAWDLENGLNGDDQCHNLLNPDSNPYGPCASMESHNNEVVTAAALGTRAAGKVTSESLESQVLGTTGYIPMQLRVNPYNDIQQP